MQRAKSFGGTRAMIYIGLFLFAFCVRMLVLGQMRSSPFFSAPFVTAEIHQRLTDPPTDRLDLFYEPSPLYARIGSAVYAHFVRHPYAARIVQGILGSLNAILIYLFARALFSSRIGILSGIVASLYGPLIYYDGQPISSTLALFFLLLTLWGLLHLRSSPNLAAWGTTGIAAGLLAIAAIPFVLIPIAAISGWVALRGRPNRASRGIVFSLGIVLPILALLWLSPTPAIPLDEAPPMRDLPIRGCIEEPSPGLLGRCYSFWRGVESGEVYVLRDYSSILSALLWKAALAFPFGLLGPLALMGIVVCCARRNAPSMGLLILFPLGYMISVVLFPPSSISRLPAMAVLIPFGVYAVQWLIRALRRKQASAWGGLLVLGGLLVGLNIDIGSAESAEHVQIHYQLGRRYLLEGKLASSWSEFKQAVSQKPNCVDTRYGLGVVYGAMGMNSEAMSAFQNVLSMQPGHIPAQYVLAMLYRNQGHPDRAMLLYRSVLQHDPGNRDAYYTLARLHMERDEYDQAIGLLKDAVALAPEHLGARLDLAIAYGQCARWDEAMAQYDTLLAEHPRDVGVLNDKGIAYAEQRKFREALAQFQKTIEIDPEYIAAYQNLALVHEQAGQVEEAIAVHRKILEIWPNRMESYRDLSRLYAKVGQREAAKGSYRKYTSLKRQKKVTEYMETVVGAFQRAMP